MRVLIIEDEEDFIVELRQMLSTLCSQLDAKVAKSRDTAFELIDSDFFDLIILDLKIPTIDGALDAVPDHGSSVWVWLF